MQVTAGSGRRPDGITLTVIGRNTLNQAIKAWQARAQSRVHLHSCRLPRKARLPETGHIPPPGPVLETPVPAGVIQIKSGRRPMKGCQPPD